MQMGVRKESRSRICKVLALTAIGTALLAIGAGAQGSKTQPIKKVEKPTKPKLVVLLVVDQMRGDYVDKFRGQWTGGLKRLLTEGAWFRAAAYPYAATETCPGHSTISTGSFPALPGTAPTARRTPEHHTN